MVFLPKAGKEKVNSFVQTRDAQRTLWGELMLRSILSQKHEIPHQEISFEKTGNGKPTASPGHIMHFNISHSGNWVTCAIAKKQVGIDVEKIKSVPLRLAKRFFSPDEYHTLVSLPEDKQKEYFFDLWTLKESYVKALGTGLRMGMQSFTIHNNEGNYMVHVAGQHEDLFFRQYHIDLGYKLAVCSEEEVFTEEVTVLTPEQIIENLSEMEEM
ncbi:MAG: 4'-phosphopantetheinyl transferase superfamily protein [Bacteroidales bacterium]|nr:4'-phosphopantetheinyl transferase superfamily protein [Bacteroidales bacterium]